MQVEVITATVQATGQSVRSFYCRFTAEEFRAFTNRLDPDAPIPADPMVRALHAEMRHALGDNSAKAVMRRRA